MLHAYDTLYIIWPRSLDIFSYSMFCMSFCVKSKNSGQFWEIPNPVNNYFTMIIKIPSITETSERLPRTVVN